MGLAGTQTCPSQTSSLRVSGNMKAMNHVPVLKGDGWLIAYSAQGLAFDLALGAQWTGAKAAWYNPRTGETGEAFNVEAGWVVEFVPPAAGRGSDWALVIRA